MPGGTGWNYTLGCILLACRDGLQSIKGLHAHIWGPPNSFMCPLFLHMTSLVFWQHGGIRAEIPLMLQPNTHMMKLKASFLQVPRPHFVDQNES